MSIKKRESECFGERIMGEAGVGGGVEARDSKEDKYILAKILIISCKYPGDRRR